MSDERNTELSVAERGELYYRLAERARLRYEGFRTFYWRITFALWTLLAAGSAFIFTTDANLTGVRVAMGTVLAVFLFIGHVWYLLYAQRRTQRDHRVSYWWETHMQRLLDEERSIPDAWKPGDWHSAYDGEQWNRPVRLPLFHEAHTRTLFITFLLAALWCWTLWSKHSADESAKTAPLVESMMPWIAGIVSGLVSAVIVSGAFYLLSGRDLRREAKKLRKLNMLTIRAMKEAGLADFAEEDGEIQGLAFVESLTEGLRLTSKFEAEVGREPEKPAQGRSE